MFVARWKGGEISWLTGFTGVGCDSMVFVSSISAIIARIPAVRGGTCITNSSVGMVFTPFGYLCKIPPTVTRRGYEVSKNGLAVTHSVL